MNPAIRFIAPSRPNRLSRLPSFLALAAGAALAATTFAEKPAALTELSVTVKESYDSNVFGTERNPTLAGRPEIADVDSWVTSIGAHGASRRRIAPGRACQAKTSSIGASSSVADSMAMGHLRSPSPSARDGCSESSQLSGALARCRDRFGSLG